MIFGVAPEDLAREFGTPLYVYDEKRLVANYRAYADAYAAVPHRICYALKANSALGILKVFAALGAGADIVSGGELRQALRASFSPKHIVFSGVGKTDEELALGLDHAIGEFNVESASEMRRLSTIAAARGTVASMTLRVNPDVDPKSHPYISTGLKENKFGVPIGEAPELLREARRLPGLVVSGVQCHIGSQLLDLEPIATAVDAIAGLSRRLQTEGFNLGTIDVGGGLGVDYKGDGALTPAQLAAIVIPRVRDLGLRLLMEPGRSLVANAGVLLTRVTATKTTGSKKFVIADAGMNDLLRPALYSAFHRIENLGASATAPRERVDVVGPVCESGDFFAKDLEIAATAEGDLIVVHDAGAYSFAMSSNYNFRPRPAEVLVEAATGRTRVLRRRETFDDLIRTEID